MLWCGATASVCDLAASGSRTSYEKHRVAPLIDQKQITFVSTKKVVLVRAVSIRCCQETLCRDLSPFLFQSKHKQLLDDNLMQIGRLVVQPSGPNTLLDVA